MLFLNALDSAINGKTKLLAEYLRSEHPLDADDRELLASFHEGKLDRKRGRPPNPAAKMLNAMRPLEAAARDVDRILVVWRKRYNRRYRVRDAAIRLAATRHGVEFDALNNRLKRAGRKPRRKRTKK